MIEGLTSAMFQSSGHLISNKLTIATPVNESDFWKVIADKIPDIDICSIEFDESGDLIASFLGGAADDTNPIFFCFAYTNPDSKSISEGILQTPSLKTLFKDAETIKTTTDHATCIADILQSLSRFMLNSLNYSSDQAYALSTLRREYERVHSRFSVLESYIARSGAGLTKERMFIAPDRQRNGEYVFVELGQGAVRQLLPVSSKGLSGIDIFVRYGTSARQGQLTVSLFAGDASQPVAHWGLPLSARSHKSGRWHALTLNRALDGMPRSLQIQFEVEGVEGAHVHLAAGPLQANRRYCAHDIQEDRAISNRPIAMRLWSAPPGLITARAGNLALSEPRQARIGGRVPAQSLAQVREMLGTRWRPSFSAVTFENDDEAIGVHPPDPGCGPTGAILDDLVPRDALSVSAVAYVAHDAAQPVEFAIALIDPDLRNATSWREATQFSGVVAWSGWRSVSPSERVQLSIFLDELQSSGRNYALAFITRMEDDGPNSFAWARFTDVIIEKTT